MVTTPGIAELIEKESFNYLKHPIADNRSVCCTFKNNVMKNVDNKR